MLLTAFSWIKDKTGYLQEFISEPRKTGTIAPSSMSLCRTMSDVVDWNHCQRIAELGAGDGVLTRHLLARMRPDASLLAFETNPRFHPRLAEIDDARLEVAERSAETLNAEYDAIFSGLPLLLLPHSVRHGILARAAALLSPQGVFVQFQYTSLSEPLLSRYFAWNRTRVMCNLPPAWVYCCHSLDGLSPRDAGSA
ncbi:methyltransferase [Erwinia tracheiphila]|uniref:class I SAM-dependent methyltransferase n=1 Tax=Erwinia tracheiphila TaxID=65700 RepID=UPI001F363452|nr:methyltransferase [Erwinia tracheiphila]UIA82665.1 methyltransferase [Erwinia tracheiphila]UIA91254.1 methyltransferase [Erwinia tracheiphila]